MLPLPQRDKYPPPKGWTGHDAPYPSGADVYTWCEGAEGDGNIALRLPDGYLGIDVDAYGDKKGAETLARLKAKLGELPATYVTSSRDDGISGIRIYRVPEGLSWKGEAGSGIELIHKGHRYAIAWPSVHPEQREYSWRNPDGDKCGIPRPDSSPCLPDAWVRELQSDIAPIPARDATPEELTQFTVALPGDGPCRRVRNLTSQYLKSMHDPGESRHVVMARAQTSLVLSGREGHPGALVALGDIRAAFLRAATTGNAARDDRTAEAEWSRALVGAVGKALRVPQATGDPCDARTLMGATVDRPSGARGTAQHEDDCTRSSTPDLG